MQYRLGNKVRIKVEAVHLENKMVDFSLMGSERKPRRAGKTARKVPKQSALKNYRLKHPETKSAVKRKMFLKKASRKRK